MHCHLPIHDMQKLCRLKEQAGLKSNHLNNSIIFLLQISTMPKEGPSQEQWRKRLRDYADGTFSFGIGQRPGKRSPWRKELDKIERCPRRGTSEKNMFDIPIKCTCGYHISSQVCS